MAHFSKRTFPICFIIDNWIVLVQGQKVKRKTTLEIMW